MHREEGVVVILGESQLDVWKLAKNLFLLWIVKEKLA
jgi:hypothetical protein